MKAAARGSVHDDMAAAVEIERHDGFHLPNCDAMNLSTEVSDHRGLAHGSWHP